MSHAHAHSHTAPPRPTRARTLGVLVLRRWFLRMCPVLERTLFVFILPMFCAFWLARGVRLLVLYVRHSKQREIDTLREQLETLEAARRAELQAAHLQRMKQVRDRKSPPERDHEGLVRGGSLFSQYAELQLGVARRGEAAGNPANGAPARSALRTRSVASAHLPDGVRAER